MMKILISAIFLMIFMNSCGETNTGRDTGDTGNTGNTGNTQADVDSDTGNTGDTGDNFPNEHDGLNWSDVSSYPVTWNEAVAYCENLGGRLPTISDLRSLIQNCPATETGGECGVTNDCLSEMDCWSHLCYGCENDGSGKYSVFGDTRWTWSSSEQSDDAATAWMVNFFNGFVSSVSKDFGRPVRCVE